MVLGVDPYLVDWLDLSFRFLHVIAAIVWIGTSFYFVALDNHLRPAEERDDLTGESWEIHGGGFYRIEKFRVTPDDDSRAAALVQVGGVHDVARGLRALRRRSTTCSRART